MPQLDTQRLTSNAEFIARRSERARLMGDVEHADRLLLQAWAVFDQVYAQD